MSARYGLEGRAVRGATRIDAEHVGFLLDGEIALADGHRVTRYGGARWTAFAGGAGFGAAVAPDLLTVFDATHLARRAYAIPGVVRAAVGPDGRVYAATSRAVYASGARGDLALVYDAGADGIHGLVASGDRVWFADGSELGVVDGDHVDETSGAKIAPDAALAASPSGDVWVLAGGTLDRFARVDAARGVAAAWDDAIAPIFARSCAACHMPGGPSGTDLSTAEAWEHERGEIRARVVTARTMPPKGHALSDEDRAAIGAWVARAANP